MTVRPIITLLTDFGTADSYVAEVKAAVLSVTRDVALVDVSHEVPPGDVMAAQYLLSRSWTRFPAGTVHLAVVDPGVGTERRALAGTGAGHCFVGPDNGIFSFVEGGQWVALSQPQDTAPGSATFHGRDVFAPAAAALAVGQDLRSLGREVADRRKAPLPAPRVVGDEVVGEVIYVDTFGSLITNLEAGGAREVRIAATTVRLCRTFGDVAPGELVAYLGSGGTVEIAVRDGSAASRLRAGRGEAVTSLPPAR